MVDVARSGLAHWANFYVIVGSSGAALTGLQFVVMALAADSRRVTSHDTIHAFGTPTIVHFSVVLVVAATLSAPWPSLLGAVVVLALTGVAGLGYVAFAARRARRQTDYEVQFEDWIWYTSLPFAAYALLLGSALTMERYTTTTLFVIAATTLLLLLGGIHNAWDSVTYIALRQMREPDGDDAPAL